MNLSWLVKCWFRHLVHVIHLDLKFWIKIQTYLFSSSSFFLGWYFLDRFLHKIEEKQMTAYVWNTNKLLILVPQVLLWGSQHSGILHDSDILFFFFKCGVYNHNMLCALPYPKMQCDQPDFLFSLNAQMNHK